MLTSHHSGLIQQFSRLIITHSIFLPSLPINSLHILMKLLILLFSTTLALFSILYKETLRSGLETLTSHFTNNITTFRGLPVFPPIQIYGIPKSANMTIPRTIRKAFLAIELSEGAGAHVRRSIGTPQLRNFSPFLMLDHFTIKPGAGFPDQ